MNQGGNALISLMTGMDIHSGQSSAIEEGKRNTSFIICYPDITLFLQTKITDELGMVKSFFTKDGKLTMKTKIMD